MRQCPACAQDIRDEARVCPYCGRGKMPSGLWWIGLGVMVIFFYVTLA